MDIGYTFKDKGLIATALCHSSYANEHKEEGIECNERLEFLGDSILGFVIAEYLYGRFPAWPEGKLSKLRASVVCETMLAKKGRELGINESLALGRGERLTGGSDRSSIIADAVEAVIGAVYLDGGIEPAKRLILSMLTQEIDALCTSFEKMDSKTVLQEIIQKDSTSPIEYEITGESGPAHSKMFEAVVKHDGHILGKGTGHSKKEAEQSAAAEAIKRFR